jgi:hypothetical protein
VTVGEFTFRDDGTTNIIPPGPPQEPLNIQERPAALAIVVSFILAAFELPSPG